MDGHFVRNFGLPYDLVRAVKGITAMPLDVHLAVDNPAFHAGLAAEAGADIVTCHPEAAEDVAGVVGEIRARGKRACFAVSPDFPLETLYPMLASPDRRADFLNLLMVKPGFVGQTLIPPMKEKLMRLKEGLRSRGEDIPVMVDGNVSFENIPWMMQYGADVLILGTSSLFRKGLPLEEGLASIRSLVRRH